MKKHVFVLMLIISTLHTNAQERCGTEALTQQLIEKYPEYRIGRERVNIETTKWINEYPNHIQKGTITIPVVVHIVWKTTSQNISDTQIESQIDILNDDFRRTNTTQINTPSVWQSIAADCEIEFCLAKTDPNGQPTNGIQRIQTNHGQFGMNSDIHTSIDGGADDWPNNDYLNIWVCDLGSGLLGYATPPSNWISDGDGVVISYKNFGNSGNTNAPYHKGRTATHEIGHWLNLDHLWGNDWGSATGCNGDDNVIDTPNQEEANYSCPGFPHNANACGTPNGDMFMNYMDYTNDACMNLFTNGQKNRMIAAINQYRPNMLNHNLCNEATSILETNITKKKLIKVIDLLGREVKKITPNIPLIYIYKDGTAEKRLTN